VVSWLVSTSAPRVAVLPLGSLRLNSAVLNAVAICITMQSMLASNKKKERCVAASPSWERSRPCLSEAGGETPRRFPSLCSRLTVLLSTNSCRPEGNDRYVRNAPSNPKHTRWHYDDDVGGRFREMSPRANAEDCRRYRLGDTSPPMCLNRLKQATCNDTAHLISARDSRLSSRLARALFAVFCCI
jgi:hypothetical protein